MYKRKFPEFENRFTHETGDREFGDHQIIEVKVQSPFIYNVVGAFRQFLQAQGYSEKLIEQYLTGEDVRLACMSPEEIGAETARKMKREREVNDAIDEMTGIPSEQL